MALSAVVGMVFGFIQKQTFGVVSENMTRKVRSDLYWSIIKKDVAWFDEKEHNPG